MMNKNFVAAKYDRPVDVLHLVIGEPQSYEGDGAAGGIEIDYSIETGEPCGAKVIGFKRNGWNRRVAELVKVIALHLPAKEKEILNAVEKAV
jgi:hypothetical protein